METKPPQHQRFANTSNTSTAVTGNLSAAASASPRRKEQDEWQNQLWRNSRKKVLWYDSSNSLSATTKFVFDCPIFLLALLTTITQSISVIDNPQFRELLRFYAQGHAVDCEPPGRTCLTESIMKAWKNERDEFHQEMKVRWTCPPC